MGQDHPHRVCTYREAEEAIRRHESAYINDCFCCACGCGFFRDKEGNRVPDSCEKSLFIERTDLDACTACGRCVPVCAYEARRIQEGALSVERTRCAGCSACEFACPEDAIQMVPR